MADQTPLYNLKAVTSEVGLSPATLRAWERRYGLLKPVRTPGGHRLYSRQDIEMLKWLVQKQAEGLSISRAAEMWQRSKEDALNLDQPMMSNLAGETVIDALRQKWLDACLAFDEQACNHILDQAFSISTPETVCIKILLQGMAQVGEGWYVGSTSAQQEHFTSTMAVRRLNALQAAAAPPTHADRILVACPPGEDHDFVLLLISYLLRRNGWDVIYLGANVPLEDLDSTVQKTSPRIVISSAQTLPAAASLRRMAEYLRTRQVPLAFGGGIFTHVPGVVNAIPGYFLGETLQGAVQRIEQLAGSAIALPEVEPVSEEYRRALQQYVENEALIVHFIHDSVPTQEMNPKHLDIAINNLSLLIKSGLELGNIGFLDPSITWLNGLLARRNITVGLTREIMLVFNLAIDRHLGADGAVINHWLMRQMISTQ